MGPNSLNIGPYMQTESRVKGSLPVWIVGDSHGIGNDNLGGLHLALQVGLSQLAVSPRWVGKLSLSEAAGRIVYDSLGSQMKHQCVSGLTTAQLIAGGTGTLESLAAALALYKPAVTFLTIGVNDSSGGLVTEYQQVLDACSAYNAFHKIVWFTPIDSNTTTNTYYNPDTSHATCRANIRSAIGLSRGNLQVATVDGAACMGLHTRYPNTTVTTDQLNANAIYHDSAHLSPEGYALMAAEGLAQAFGMTQLEVLRLMCQVSPFAPVDWGYPGTDGNIVAAAAETYMVASSSRKAVMTNFEVYNPHAATTAVVTVSKRRVPLADLGETNPAADNGTSTAFRVFKVAAGTRDGWSLPMESAPAAWLNEGWTVSCTGADVNVTAMGKQVLHTVS